MRIAFLLLLLILAGPSIGRGQSGDRVELQRLEDRVDRLEEDLHRYQARLDEHVVSDYKNFTNIYSLDADKLNGLVTRMAVLESTMSQNTRILWGIVVAVALQLFQVLMDLLKKRKG